MKRAIFVLFLLLPILLLPTFVSANQIKENESTNSLGSCQPVFSKEVEEKIKEYKDEDSSLPESYSIDFINSIVNFAGINTLANLVFGNPYCVWSDEEKTLVYGIFTEDEYEKIVEPMVKLFKSIFVSILTISIMITGLKFGLSGISGKFRSEFWKDVIMWFLVVIFLFSYDLLIEFVFMLNTAVLGGFKGLLDSNGLDYTSVSLMTANSKFSFTDIVVFFAEWLLSLYLNFIYIFRKVVILILVILGNLAGISLLFSKTRPFFFTWLREICGLTFIQSFHGLILTIYISLSSLLSSVNGTFFKMAALILFIPLTSMIMSWMKLSDSNSALEKGGMLGVGSMAAAAKVTSYALSKRSLPMKHPDFAKQGLTKISERAQGRNSSYWNAMKSGAGKTGAIIGGTVGLVLGPQGVMLGAMAGKGLTTGLLQGTRNIAAFGANTANTFKDLKNSGGLKANLTDIGKRSEFFGNLGETAGALISQGGVGRRVGHALSGVSRQRLLNSHETGGFGGVNLQKLGQMHTDQNVKWIQDNKGSALYLDKGNDNLERISPFGAADPSLSAGIQREIGYKFGNPISNLGQASNGTYSMPKPNELVGSSSSLQRTTDATLRGPNGSLVDSNFNAQGLNPDSYYSPGMQGADTRSAGDRVADSIHGFQNMFRDNKESRHRGFL